MTADPRAIQLERVAELRRKRLERAAGEARDAAAAASAAAERAASIRAAAAAARSEARAMFRSAPACAQARLWLERTAADETGAVAALAERSARLDIARDAQDAAVERLTRHQLRSDAVAEHHRALRRAGDRRAEDRIEAETPMTIRVRRI